MEYFQSEPKYCSTHKCMYYAAKGCPHCEGDLKDKLGHIDSMHILYCAKHNYHHHAGSHMGCVHCSNEKFLEQALNEERSKQPPKQLQPMTPKRRKWLVVYHWNNISHFMDTEGNGWGNEFIVAFNGKPLDEEQITTLQKNLAQKHRPVGGHPADKCEIAITNIIEIAYESL